MQMLPENDTMLGRLMHFWVYGGFLAGLLLFALTPLIAAQWPVHWTAVWLLLPVYMVHQYEEHDADRFRNFVNANMFGGRDGLSIAAVFYVNIILVWVLISVALYLAAWVRPGLGLIAAWLVLFNMATHAGNALFTRSYNPGLATAVTLFPAFGIWAVLALNAAGATIGDHLIGFAVAFAGHAGIVINARLRLAGLKD